MSTSFFSLFYVCVQEQGQVAFLAGKKNGNAVWRNSAKRKLRAAWQQRKQEVGRFDIILLAHRNITKQSSHELARVLDDVLFREGLLE